MGRDFIPPLSSGEVRELGELFHLGVNEGNLETVRERTNGWLDGLDEVYDVPLPERDPPPGERTWRDPEVDEHNAVATVCHVPPVDEGSGPLADVEVGVKDNIAVAGVPMRCGSPVMRGFVPGADATVIERIRAAGGTITAKTNLSEFAAVLLSSEKRPVTNPHDENRIAGSTSSGSAVAVSTGMVDVALGTDTGGSVRVPASFCGVVGYKPTYGVVPLRGVVENTYTQDHVGTFATSVEETAALLEAISGKDDRDPASLQSAGRDGYSVGGYVAAVEDAPDPSDVELGILEEGFGEGVSTRVTDTVDEAVDRLESAGVSVRTVSIDSFGHARPIKSVLSLVELATHWRDGGAAYRRGGTVDESYQVDFANRTRASSGDLQDPYRSKLLAGAKLVADHHGRHYTRAQAAREVVTSDFEEAVSGVDALGFPTVPDVAPTVEDVVDFDSLDFDIARNTVLANVTRTPAVTLPCGDVDGLPVGLQLASEAFADDELLGIAATVHRHVRPER